jgi:hypothetical protein
MKAEKSCHEKFSFWILFPRVDRKVFFRMDIPLWISLGWVGVFAGGFWILGFPWVTDHWPKTP